MHVKFFCCDWHSDVAPSLDSSNREVELSLLTIIRLMCTVRHVTEKYKLSRRSSTGFAMQLCEQPRRSTTSASTLSESSKNLYDKATSAVLFNGSTRDWFRTTFGVRQECLLSPTLFNIFLERIMTGALEDHEGTISTGGRTITNLCFADDIDGLAE